MKTIVLFFVLVLSYNSFADGKKPSQPYQKPGAPIRIAEPALISMAANDSETVAVQFATANTGRLTIVAKPKAGIEVSDVSADSFDLAAGKPTLTFTLTSREDGNYHVMFHAKITDAESSLTRVFGIPVVVGNPAPVQNKAHPEHVIMEAQETVR